MLKNNVLLSCICIIASLFILSCSINNNSENLKENTPLEGISEKSKKKQNKNPDKKHEPLNFVQYKSYTIDDDNHNGIPDFADYEATNPFMVNIMVFDKRADPPKSFFTFYYNESSPNEVEEVNNDGVISYIPGKGVARVWSVNGDQGRDKREINKGGDFIKSDVKYPAEYFKLNRSGNINIYLEIINKESETIEVEWDNNLEEDMEPIVFELRPPKKGEDISMPLDEDFDKLWKAVNASNFSQARVFLAKGLNPNYRYKWEPLIIRAVKNNDIKMVKLLLEFKAKINAIDGNGFTPLYHAVENNFDNITSLILSKNVIFSPRYKRNNDALLVAVENNSSLMFEILKKGANLDYAYDRKGYSAVKQSLIEKDQQRLSMLMKIGADPDGIGAESLLLYSVRKNNFDQIEFLLKNGLSPNVAEGDKESALLWTVINKKHMPTAKLLLEYGADPNYKSRFQVSLLHLAIRQNNYNLVALLLEAGANIEIQDSRGNTPLMMEVQYFQRHRNQFGKMNLDIINKLLEYGAKTDVKNKRNNTIMGVALQTHNGELLSLLLKYGADPFMLLMDEKSTIANVVEKGKLKTIIHFLESDALNQLNLKDRDKVITAIGESINRRDYRNKDIELVYPLQLVLMKHIDAYEKNSIGKNIIDYAINAKKYYLTVMLDNKGQYKDKYAELYQIYLSNKLREAVKAKDIDKVRQYIKQGAITDKGNHNELLFLAEQRASIDIIKLLLQSGLSPEAVHPKSGISFSNYVRNRKNNEIARLVSLVSYDKSYVQMISEKSPYLKIENKTDVINQNAVDFIWNAALAYEPTINKVAAVYYGANYAKNFIKTHADINQNEDYHLPIISVAAYGEPYHYQYLLDRKAEINEIDVHSGKTALMTAVLYGNVNIIKALLKSGVDLNVKSREGLEAVDYAYKEENREIIRLLDLDKKYKKIDLLADRVEVHGKWNFSARDKANCSMTIIKNSMTHDCDFLTQKKYVLKRDGIGLYIELDEGGQYKNNKYKNNKYRINKIMDKILVLYGFKSSYAFRRGL